MPFEFHDPNNYQLTWWGEKTSGINGHDGLDFLLPTGTEVLSAGDGVVVRSGISDPFYCPPLRRNVDDSLGVEIAHKLSDGTTYITAYFHLSKIFVAKNQTVKSGQLIGLSGDSGCATLAHLHFTVDRFPGTNNGQRVHVDPFGWDSGLPDPWAAHKDGSKSAWLWKKDQAPLVFREENNPLTNSGPQIKITTLRWMGWKDTENPNNEFVQLEIDSQVGTNIDISGYTLRNLKGDSFVFPKGSIIRKKIPFGIYTGSGIDTGDVVYLNQLGGIWDDMADCAILKASNGDTVNEVGYGGAKCP